MCSRKSKLQRVESQPVNLPLSLNLARILANSLSIRLCSDSLDVAEIKGSFAMACLKGKLELQHYSHVAQRRHRNSN